MKNKIKITGEYIAITYSYLRTVSYGSFQKAKDKEKGWFNNCVISMLFSAFSLEAYFNHLGAEKCSCWPLIERKLSPKEKLKILLKKIGMNVDLGKRPFQTTNEIFKFRHSLVHGRTQRCSFNEDIVSVDENDEPDLLVSWEKKVNLKTAEKFLNDAKKIITQLHSQAGLGDCPLATIGKTTYREI